jgi:hypothetical protein
MSNRVERSIIRRLIGGQPHFSIEKNLRHDELVRCPNCRNEFVSEGIRYFGVLTPRGLRILLLLYLAGFLVVVAYIAVTRVIQAPP